MKQWKDERDMNEFFTCVHPYSFAKNKLSASTCYDDDHDHYYHAMIILQNIINWYQHTHKIYRSFREFVHFQRRLDCIFYFVWAYTTLFPALIPFFAIIIITLHLGMATAPLLLFLGLFVFLSPSQSEWTLLLLLRWLWRLLLWLFLIASHYHPHHHHCQPHTIHSILFSLCVLDHFILIFY